MPLIDDADGLDEVAEWNAWCRPADVLRTLASAEESPASLALTSQCWYSLQNAREAWETAVAAEASGATRTLLLRAITVQVCVTIARGDDQQALRQRQVELVESVHTRYSDASVCSLINIAQIVNDAGEAAQALGVASEIHKSLDYGDDRLRESRALLIDYIGAARARMSLDQRTDWLLEFLRKFDESRQTIFAALVHTSLADIFQQKDLYTLSFLHSNIAAQHWRANGRDERLAALAATRFGVLAGLGMDAEAEHELRVHLDAGIGSRRRILRGENLALLSHLAARNGRLAEAAELALQAAEAVEVGDGSFFDEISPWILAADLARQIGDQSILDLAVRTMRTMLKRPDAVGPAVDFAKIHLASAIGDRAGAVEASERFKARWPSFQPRDGQSIDDILFSAINVTPFGVEKNFVFEDDLVEFWSHLEHVTGEDDELVRGYYIRSNCIPVLNRLLGVHWPHVTPDLQIELIELVRFGSISLSAATGPRSIVVSGRESMRKAGREHWHGRLGGLHTVLGAPFPLRFGRNPTTLAARSGVAPKRVAGLSLLSRTPYSDAVLMQLYLRGSTLHWSLWTPASERTATGSVRLGSETLQLLSRFRTLMCAIPGEIEARMVADNPRRRPQVEMIAAARVALSPMANSRQLAYDLLCHFSTRDRNTVWSELNRIDFPSLARVQAALGDLLPPETETAVKGRPLLLSLGKELATLPFAIAQTNPSGDPLIFAAVPEILPPINLLNACAVESREENLAWHVISIGNALGDLAFAGAPSTSEAIVSALMLNDEAIAASLAVIYRGHLRMAAAGRPGASGIVLGPDTLLTGEDMLRDGRRWHAPKRLGLMACRGAGWDLGNEWGGVAAAAMLRGSETVVAPLWPLLDAPQTAVLDSLVLDAFGLSQSVSTTLQQAIANMFANWTQNNDDGLAPHWSASLAIMNR